MTRLVRPKVNNTNEEFRSLSCNGNGPMLIQANRYKICIALGGEWWVVCKQSQATSRQPETWQISTTLCLPSTHFETVVGNPGNVTLAKVLWILRATTAMGNPGNVTLAR